MDYLVAISDSGRLRKHLDRLGISWKEKRWQPGIRQFTFKDEDVPRLKDVFGVIPEAKEN